jgi:hypothetical protein
MDTLIAGIPHPARHSRTPEGEPIPQFCFTLPVAIFVLKNEFWTHACEFTIDIGLLTTKRLLGDMWLPDWESLLIEGLA